MQIADLRAWTFPFRAGMPHTTLVKTPLPHSPTETSSTPGGLEGILCLVKDINQQDQSDHLRMKGGTCPSRKQSKKVGRSISSL